jgi:hypothetical protein
LCYRSNSIEFPCTEKGGKLIQLNLRKAVKIYFSFSGAAVLNVGYAYPLGVRRESSKVARSSNKVAKLVDYPVKCL